jgi:hypothetical protein
MLKKCIAIAMTTVLFAILLSSTAFAATSTLTVDTSVNTGAIKYGGIGWLYGLGENTQPADSYITGLVHPQYSGQKAPWGLQHDNGDALNVAVQAKRTGMKGIGIYVQDYYAQWPYPKNGISSYITNVVDKVCASVVADPNRTFFHYIPFNEPDWIWYGTSGTNLTNFCNDWKTVYNRIRTLDPGAKIAGPGFSTYNASAYSTFFAFCKNNNCLPDITTWHELDGSFFSSYDTHYNNYRSIESSNGISPREVYINEYGQSSGEIGRPGKMIQYLSKFERTKVYGSTCFWTGVGTLNDLISTDGRATGCWYLYQWYGQMTGNTVQVTPPSLTDPLQGIATKSAADTAKVIFGGSANSGDVFDCNVVVKGLSGSTVNYTVQETNYTGTSYQAPPATIKSGTAAVSGGQATITVTGCKALSAYLVNITPGSGGGGIVSGGTYKLISRSSGKALDVSQGSQADGGNVIQWTDNGGNNQKWTISDVGGGNYRLINVNSGKALDVNGGSQADGGDVIQWTYTGGNNQKWTISDIGGGYYRLINVNSGKALDVYQASTADGADVVQWTYSGSNNQQWQLIKLN